jgi:protein TonB
MLDDTPRTRFQKSPVYPRLLKNAGETGTVWVDFMVDERGYVHDARVVKSTNPGFNDVTLAALSEWKFEPGKRNGIPVRFRMSLPMVFAITS